MSIIYILIPIAMLFVTIAVILFFWAIRSNQYDDLDREGINILFDEETPNTDLLQNKKTAPSDSEKTDLESSDADQ
ncbi:MAG: cbb3-type cytochrome oxidase maturation protein [Psychromonas sp.]|jgi:cbb3-type cytochrome oxidase maturation protein|uniref:cbb3-type cytochrome oxidase assembly protein CcoS n=1 Tax=Psychromonas sp. TaxID=1884585 RepID=UPI0039E220EC